MRLQNQDIWLAYPKLLQLSQMALPIEVSMGIAKLIKSFQIPYAKIEHKRRVLVGQYGEVDGAGQIGVSPESEQAGDFAVAFGNLLIEYWEDDISVEPVTLPDKIESICKECGHKMEIVFLVDPDILAGLQGLVSSPSGGCGGWG